MRGKMRGLDKQMCRDKGVENNDKKMKEMRRMQEKNAYRAQENGKRGHVMVVKLE